ncbi:MAG: replicative DNA helicase [Oscillibacter sp.]|nr:replicative DNA helicase [Oscillibacter sp.]
MANEDLLLRQAPHSVEAEQAVLGSMLIDPDCVKLVMEKLRPADFYLETNKEIFETIYTMFSYSRPIDGITVAEEMRKNRRKQKNKNETYDETTTRSYLAQLMEITPTSANVMEYAGIVADKALLRAVAEAASEITTLVQEGTGEARAILEAAEQRIYAIRKGQGAKGLVPLKQVLPDVLDRLGEMSETEDHLPGLSTGLSAIDRKIMGLNRSDLILLAARPGMGKTSMALNVALNVARSTEKTVAIFSLEMSKEQLATRILSVESLVDNYRLKTGELDEADWEKIAASVVTLSRMDILLDDDPLLTVADMNAKCRRLDNLGLVVIDYLQLMSSSGNRSRGNENRQQVVSDMSRMLKIMAKELDVPVVCLSQLSRANEKRDDKRPQLSDLRESGAIEQDADIVMFLYRDDYYNEDSEKHNIAECIVAKNRHGETGTVELRWMPQYTMFATLERREDE